MNNKPYNINPLDLRPEVAIGVSLPFDGNSVFRSTYTTKDQIKSNLVNLFSTSPGERLFQPQFGLNLFLFENITEETLEEIQNQIINIIDIYFPQIEINTLTITALPDENGINIFLSYDIYNSSDTLTLNINN